MSSKSDLTLDSQGNLFGEAQGGYGNNGIVFKFALNAASSPFSVLHTFTQPNPDGTLRPDGSSPQSGPIIDAAGNLYGTTFGGNTAGVLGIVYKLSPPAVLGDPWTETILYSFSGGSDGGGLNAGVIMDTAGKLYGTATLGGSGNNAGVVFEVDAGVSLAVAESGSGSVVSSPAGINCPSTCSATFAPGTQVTLTATAAAGYTFSGWGGGTCSGTGTCLVATNSLQTVSATFAQNTAKTLSVSKAGSGSVTSSPPGINCPTVSCVGNFTAGSTVSLTASPPADFAFVGWSGACSGTAGCTVTMNSNQNVMVTFQHVKKK